MATTPIEMEVREVVRCTFADCRLTQFKTANCLCRRCHRPLELEEPVRPGPIALALQVMEPSAEAGLQVAGQVREIRRARHMSQRQLAGRMQVPRTYISKIENGKAIPTLSSLDRLADALGVDVRQLVRDTRSLRDDEVASIFADPLLAEIAALLPSLDPLHRSLLYGAARDMATSHRRSA
jgi:transcriptional regulator with XRE-family HTH domain